MAEFRCRHEPPVSIRWRNLNLYTCGPWCQGPVRGALRWPCLKRLALDGLEHNSTDYIHLVVEVLKSAFADREYRYGDPAFVDVQIAELFSDQHLLGRVDAIDRNKAMPDMPGPLGPTPCGLDWLNDGVAPTLSAERAGDTTYLCVIDRWGNAMSATPSGW